MKPTDPDRPKPDLGEYLTAGLRDVPLGITPQDPPPTPGSPFDAALAALHAAATGDDAENDQTTHALWAERQTSVRDAINGVVDK